MTKTERWLNLFALDGPVLRPAIQTLLKTTLSGFVADWTLDDSEGAFRLRLR
ncbi:MAG: hypothetical protein ACREMC_09380 [Gemmatimonadales bacterium]